MPRFRMLREPAASHRALTMSREIHSLLRNDAVTLRETLEALIGHARGYLDHEQDTEYAQALTRKMLVGMCDQAERVCRQTEYLAPELEQPPR
jgi:hypothetical protein